MKIIDESYKKSHRKPKVDDQILVVSKCDRLTGERQPVDAFYIVSKVHDNNIYEVSHSINGDKYLFDGLDEFHVFDHVNNFER